MAKYHFSTVASDVYLYKFIVLYQTLKHHTKDFILHVLCMDDEAYPILAKLNYENLKLVHLSELEDPSLLNAKSNRSSHEYCWTVKSAMLCRVMNENRDAEYFAHMDADLCMFDDVGKIFNEAPGASLYLTDHNNSDKFLYTYKMTGRFNTGFVGCRNCPEAFNAVRWWREKSLEWCYNRTDTVNRLYGDQRYVERWPEMFRQVHVVRTPGANTAIWNIEKYNVSLRGTDVYINDSRLIFHHFSGLSLLSPREFNLSWFYRLSDKVVEYIYKPYFYLLNGAINTVKTVAPEFHKGFAGRNEIPDIHYCSI